MTIVTNRAIIADMLHTIDLPLLGNQRETLQEENKSIGREDGMSTGGTGLNELTRRGRCIRVRLKLKGCPRCKGDVIVEVDQWGWYENCIQCGYLHDLPNVVEVKQQMAQRRHNREQG